MFYSTLMKPSRFQVVAFALSLALLLGLYGFASYQQSEKLYKHAVTVTFKSGTSDTQIGVVDKSFKGLAKLKMVRSYEWGVVDDTKDPAHVKHVYVFTFGDKNDLPLYGASPEHQAHMKVGAEYIEAVSAVQYFQQ